MLGRAEPTTIDELREIVCPSPNKGRLKFVTRVVHILNFVYAHPETVTQLGAGWCRDGRHFVANSKTLGSFLGLKSNSINTNFRDHGFQIMTCQRTELQKDYPVLSDIRHWKKRYISLDWFKVGVDPKEADKMMVLSEKVSESTTTPIPSGSAETPSFIPRSLANIDRAQMVGIMGTMLSIPKDSNAEGCEWFSRVIDTVYQFWSTVLGMSSWTAPVDEIIEALCFQAPGFSTSEREQLAANIEFLLVQKSEYSQADRDVTFENFLKFFLRYGSSSDWLGTLREITYFNQSPGYLTFGLNSFESQGRGETMVQFNSWFSPSSDKDAAIASLYRTADEAWIVRPSSTPTRFTLLYKQSGSTDIQALYITYDCLADSEHRFSLETCREGRVYCPTFRSVLIDKLGLTVNEQRTVVAQDVRPRYVSADEFTTRRSRQETTTDVGTDSWMGELPGSSQGHAPWSSQFTFSQLDGGSQFM